jgi:hypothetical protein
MFDRSPLRGLVFPSLLGCLALACGGGGGGGGSSTFEVTISIQENQEVRLNQEIVFTFSAPVDFSTVSQNTINIRSTTGIPATGTYSKRGDTRVVFQPSCPTDDLLTNGGFQLGLQYEVIVFGRSAGAANTVKSTRGEPVGFTQSRRFRTPTSTDRELAFIDLFPSIAPTPVLRSADPLSPNHMLADACYVEIGGSGNKAYFERDGGAVFWSQDDRNRRAPLNLYSDSSTSVRFIVQLNQAVDPSPVNVSSDTLGLEYLQDVMGTPTWFPIETLVTLESNCTSSGARVSLEPIGVLPSGTMVRVIVRTGLSDLVGDSTSQDNTELVVRTAPIAFANLSPVDELSDALVETFDFGGSSVRSREDRSAPFAFPNAEWGDGRLTATFEFDEDLPGGPGGDFDWVVAGQQLTLDSTQAFISAPDNRVQDVRNGVLHVRNLTIETGASVKVVGPNPLVINASGTVTIRGTLDVSGNNAVDVVSPDTGNVREVGGAGNAGGGKGGDANLVTTNSSAIGGTGQGPYAQANRGGGGGETAFASESLGTAARYPGGGGGGRFAANQGSQAAEDGLAGTPTAQSAVNAARAPLGGPKGVGPFTDGATNTDFFGTRATVAGGLVVNLVRGELPRLWAGYGGGGGGNANPATVFPTPSWTPASDEKGGAGGGGGGGVHIRALGPIVFGASGVIRSNGGRGARGESILNQDRVGGSGGSGSGGHIVLETAAYVDFTDGGANPGLGTRDWLAARGGPTIARSSSGSNEPSEGGAGGPGVIQIHVPDVTTALNGNPDVVLPTAGYAASNPLDFVASPPAILAIPNFSSKSMARSQWVSVGAAEQKPGGVTALMRFLFGGIEPTDGKVLVDGTDVRPNDALLDEDLEGSSTLSILSDRVTLEVRGSSLDTAFVMGTSGGLSNDLYLRNPALMEAFQLRLEVAEDLAVFQDFEVARAAHDEGTPSLGDERLTLTVSPVGAEDLQSFSTANTGAGTIHVRLIPRFFRVYTGEDADTLTASSFVRLRFQAARDDGFGAPDEGTPLVDWTSDLTDFNGLAPGDLQFFRFEVEFDLADGAALTPDTERISLDFLRIPFVF